MLKTLIILVLFANISMASEFGDYKNPKNYLLSINFSYNVARALHIAAEHRIADRLEQEPKTLNELAKEMNVNKDVLYRIMKVLVTHDVFDYTSDNKFKLNENSKLLLSNHPQSLRATIAKEMDLRRWNSIGNLEISLRSGNPSFEMLYEESFSDYLESNAGAKARFDAGVSDSSVNEDIVLSKAFNFNDYDTVVDVGGGQGSLIYQILKIHKDVEGVLFDLPGIVEHPKYLENKNIEHRYEVFGGNLFEKVPEGGDVYILKRVLNKWNNEKALQILKNCAKNVKKNGRILIIDIIDEGLSSKTKPSPFIDAGIISMVLNKENERSIDQFQELCNKAGLKIIKVYRPEDIKLGIIEAAKM